MTTLDDLKHKSENPSTQPQNRKVTTALLVGVAAAVLILGWKIFGDTLSPRQHVEMASVLLLETESASGASPVSASAKTLAQASGWIEPNAFPFIVAAQTGGTVLEINVLSGETVTNGQVLATLNPEDARLAVNTKRAEKEQALMAVATRKSLLVRAQESVAQAEANVSQALSQHHVASDKWARIKPLQKGDVSELERVTASNEVIAAEASLHATRAAHSSAKAEVGVQQATLAVEKAAVDKADANLDLANLHLTRTSILSPMDGVVMKRLVNPGDELEGHNSSVLSLYDPEKLQVRVDVPLADIRHITVGQAVSISCNAFGNKRFDGRVSRITGEADISRNTLQVKVDILDPHSLMRPEMLCRVEFLSSKVVASDEGRGMKSLWLPEAALMNRNDDSAEVWMVDPVSLVVSRVSVEVFGPVRDGLIQVATGLKAGDKVVTSRHTSLSEGSRVQSGGDHE